ncbi:hypothetical protein [Schaedlerella arabinosiphila]|uniref:hypothetical protein n=1 Tax=Schaedlerella arabinosiphila TaxID=2044587 RepID=UPI00039D1ABA|nr:hypothetical protein [Schaedlerella arabinosiphila]
MRCQVFFRLETRLFGGRPEKSYFMLFSKGGFTERVLEEAREKREVLLVDLEELLES